MSLGISAIAVVRMCDKFSEFPSLELYLPINKCKFPKISDDEYSSSRG